MAVGKRMTNEHRKAEKAAIRQMSRLPVSEAYFDMGDLGILCVTWYLRGWNAKWIDIRPSHTFWPEWVK
jgi:hypothetical protein